MSHSFFDWFGLGGMLMNLCLFAYLVLAGRPIGSRSFATKEEVTGLDKRVTKVEEQAMSNAGYIKSLDERMQRQASEGLQIFENFSRDFHQLAGDVKAGNATMKGIKELLDRTQNSVSTLAGNFNQYLMERKGS